MHRSFVFGPIALLAVACSSSKAPPEVAVPPELQKIAKLIPATATTIARNGPDDPTIKMFSTLAGDKDPCWADLVKKLKTSYWISNAARDQTVVIIDGTITIADLESCVPKALEMMGYKVSHEGDRAVFKNSEGNAIEAVAKDGMVIAGQTAFLTEVLTGPRATAPWGARLVQLPTGMMATATIDPLATTLFGIPTAGYDFVIDNEKPPKGRVLIRTKSAADAATAAKKLATGELAWPTPPPAKLADAVKKLAVKVVGDTVEISFEETAFADIDKDELGEFGKALIMGKTKK